MKVKATTAILECLLEQGVDTIFGYPGGTILNIYDELYHYQGKLRHILTAHEQGAAHAADGYARSTGKVGVCFATSGPGATNLTTGIATAYYDSSPVVFITCNVTENLLGKDAFQEVDITGISMPITKCNYLVKDPGALADVLREAFAIARSGRPGPVLVDIAKNVTAAEADYEPLPLDQHANHGRLGAMLRRASHDLKTPEPDAGDIQTLLDLIEGARKPLVLVGGGVIRSKGAVPQFRTFIERLNAPVASTIMGGGACPGNHRLFTGMIGMHGSHASNLASDQCDLLIAVGCRFSDRVATDPATFDYYKRIPERYDNARVVMYKGGFNFSRINNFGRKYAAGKYLLLLNNDIEVIGGDWLTQMAGECAQPGVGICGAMLYYPDDTIQHAGIITGLGGYAGHSHKYHKRGGSGYMFRLATVQDFSAVTAACLLVRTAVYDSVHGLDEEFTVAYNDVDFCLRVRDAGWRIVWTPYAELYHHESKSRGSDENDPAKKARFDAEHDRLYAVHGKENILHDPYYSPSLSLDYEDFRENGDLRHLK